MGSFPRLLLDDLTRHTHGMGRDENRFVLPNCQVTAPAIKLASQGNQSREVGRWGNQRGRGERERRLKRTRRGGSA